MITVQRIAYKPKDADPKPADHFSRVELEEAQLVKDYGIEGDAKGGSGDRQLNLMCYDTVQQLNTEGFNTEPGQLGEQIVVQGCDVATLNKGDVLKIGEDALIEVVGLRNGCKRFRTIQNKEIPDYKDRIGIMAKVIEGGMIRVGSTIEVIHESDNVGIRHD